MSWAGHLVASAVANPRFATTHWSVVLARAKPGEAAVVIGDGGRTILNLFFIEDVASVEDAIRFAQKQIEFLINPLLPIQLLSAAWVDGEFQFQLTGGRAGLACSQEATDDWFEWTSVTNVLLSTNPILIRVPAAAPRSLYRAVTLPVPRTKRFLSHNASLPDRRKTKQPKPPRRGLN